MSRPHELTRRGLRRIVSRGPVVDGCYDLTLECGHVVRRGASPNSQTRPTAVCPQCAKVDGQKRDDARAGRQ